MKIYHPPLIPPIVRLSAYDEVKGGIVPTPLVGEGLGEGYFRANSIMQNSLCIINRGRFCQGAPWRRIADRYSLQSQQNKNRTSKEQLL